MLAFTTVASADQLADDRVASAARVYGMLQASLTKAASPEELYRWSVHWLDAELDAQPKLAAKAFADQAKRMADIEASYYRLEADLWAKRGKK